MTRREEAGTSGRTPLQAIHGNLQPATATPIQQAVTPVQHQAATPIQQTVTPVQHQAATPQDPLQLQVAGSIIRNVLT